MTYFVLSLTNFFSPRSAVTLVFSYGMAKPQSWHWDHFHCGDKQNSAHRKAYCKYCVSVKLKKITARDEVELAEGKLKAPREQETQFEEGILHIFCHLAYNNQISLARNDTTSITGRRDIMNNHLKTCPFVPTSVKERAIRWKKQAETAPSGSGSATPTKKHERSESTNAEQQEDHASKKQRSFQVLSVKAIPYDADKQECFENQLLKAFVSSGTAFNKIDDPEIQKLFKDFMPSATLPTRQRLEKDILRRVVVQVEGEITESVRGKLATISCDGWQDVSKKHLVAFMITVDGKVSFSSFHFLKCN